MKPIILKFSGINCFEAEQTINFQNLGGVFGIFGSTGSGKTTILDAISIALFGETPRLGGKNYLFINNKTKAAKVELTFESQKEYTIIREYKDKNGNIESSAVLMQNENTLAEGVRDVNAKILDIIKMTASDYSKCIALPQGEFAAFLKSSSAERTALVGKLFGLEEYGDALTKAANSKKALLEQKCLILSEQIASMGANIQNEINDLFFAQNELKNNIDNSNKKLEELLASYQKQQKQNAEYEKYDNLMAEHNKLIKQKPEIEQKQLLLKNHKMANENKTLLLQLKDQQQQLNQNNAKLQKAKKDLDLASFDVNSQNKLLEELNSKAKTIKSSEQIILQLNELKQREKTITKLREEASEIEKTVSKEQQSIKSFESEILNEKQFVSQDTNRQNELNSSFKDIQKRLSEINESGDSIGPKIRGKTYQDVLKVAANEYQKLKDENDLLTSEVLAQNEKIENINSKLSSISISLCINENINDVLLKKRKLLFKLNSIKNQLNFIKDQQSNIQNEKDLSITKINNLQSEIEQYQSRLKEFESAKTQQLQKIKQIEKERDLSFVKDAECTVAKETDIGSPCPICGNTVSRLFAQKSTTTSYYDNALTLAKKEMDQIALQTKELEIKKENAKFKIDELALTIKDFDKSLNSLSKLQNQILIEFIDATDNQLNEFENLIAKTEDDIKTLEDANKKCNELIAEKDTLFKLKETKGIYLQKNNQNAEILFNYCEKLRKYIAENDFVLLQDGSIGSDYARLKQALLEKQEILNSQIIALTKEIELHNSSIKILEQKKEHSAEKIGTMQARLQEIASENEQFKTDFDQLCHGYETVQDKLDKVATAKESIETELAKTSNKVRELTIELVKTENCYNLIKNTTENNQKTCEKLQIELKDVFEYFGTKNIDEIVAFIVKNPEEIEKQVSDYLFSLQANEKEINTIGKIESRDNTDYEKLIENETAIKNKNIEKFGALKEQIAAKKALAENQLAKEKELEQEKKNLDLATQLCSLLRGKELLAFASEIYLQDITRKASEKLFSLLSGRYTLCYENKDFFVLDNYNNRIKRSCATLSGGETFVVSLSLALSISETILAHAAQKSEFFFLDEGFGTLDSSLRDNIVDSLIKLNESGITIGLITHVEELKSEIKNRLIVSQELDDFGNIKSKIRFEQDI